MNYTRIVLATLGGFVAYMAMGSVMFVAIPALKREFGKFPAVYRDHKGQMSHMPLGMAAMLLSIVVLAVLFAMIHPAGAGMEDGAIYGALIGFYALGSFVIHNHVNLNIGVKVTLYSGIVYFIEWTVVGVVISLIYKPS
jgi:hypothetical protein